MIASRRSLALRLLLTLIIAVSAACSVWYSTAKLDSTNWDEGHSMRNIRSILMTGSWRPLSPFYPGLSHLPQAVIMSASQSLYRRTGNPVFEVIRPNGNFTATAFLLGRWTSGVYGVGVLWMVFWIGRRIFSEEVGVLAAAILALSPFFLKVSAIYKPDPVLMLTALVAFYFAVRAAEEGRARNYLLAGTAIGLSAASKQNGAFSSIPLIVVTALGYRDTKRWLWLAAAGALSVLVFLVLNPWLDLLPEYLSMGERYSKWAQFETVPAPHTLVYAAELPFHWAWHGVALGSIAWLGLIGLGVVAFKKRRQWPEQAGATLLVAFAVAYPLACAVVSTHPKANIFVPTLPFTSLAAAWALARTGRLLLERAPRRLAVAALALGSAALVVTSTIPYANYLYEVAVPETRKAAGDWIARNAGALRQRTIVSEGSALSVGQKPWNRQIDFPLELSPERLSNLTASQLDLADYEIFPRRALESESRDFYEARIARLGRGSVRVFERRALRLRGEGLVVLAHPWRTSRTRRQEATAAVPVDWRHLGHRRLFGNFPRRFKVGQVVSLDLALTPEQARECTLAIDGKQTPVHRYQWGEAQAPYMTQRFALAKGSAPIRIACPRRKLLELTPEVEVIRWYPR